MYHGFYNSLSTFKSFYMLRVGGKYVKAHINASEGILQRLRGIFLSQKATKN